VENKSGKIEVSLPSNGRFQIDASARRGEVESDFPEISVKKDNDSGSMSGSVGKNGVSVKLSTTFNNIALRKQS
jgi:hypothetical protein